MIETGVPMCPAVHHRTMPHVYVSGDRPGPHARGPGDRGPGDPAPDDRATHGPKTGEPPNGRPMLGDPPDDSSHGRRDIPGVGRVHILDRRPGGLRDCAVTPQEPGLRKPGPRGHTAHGPDLRTGGPIPIYDAPDDGERLRQRAGVGVTGRPEQPAGHDHPRQGEQAAYNLPHTSLPRRPRKDIRPNGT
jgi:hypothetical protein